VLKFKRKFWPQRVNTKVAVQGTLLNERDNVISLFSVVCVAEVLTLEHAVSCCKL
jgi:hypothetical protein